MFKTTIAATAAGAAKASVGYGGFAAQGAAGYGQGYQAAASTAGSAAVSGYDNDANAQQSHGSDSDWAWGKSYDSVKANSYDDEQYQRMINADDDIWAEDYDEYVKVDVAASDAAASSEHVEGDKVTVVAHDSHDHGLESVHLP